MGIVKIKRENLKQDMLKGRSKIVKTVASALALLLVLSCVIIVMASPAPTLQFLPPTPDNNSYQTANFAEINISINESALDTFKFNWNGTNYTFYNSSLVLAMNFNNNSEIGDNETNAADISKYKNNGTFVNGSTGNWTADGWRGGAMEFDGSDYVTVHILQS